MLGMNSESVDLMLEQWAREMRDVEQAYPPNPLGGSIALLETGNHKTRGNSSTRIHATETRRVSKPEIHISTNTARVESAMVKIKAVNDEYYDALSLSYRVDSIRTVARIMKVTYAKARALRKSAFDMVCLLLI